MLQQLAKIKSTLHEMRNCQKRNDANVAVLLKKNSCTLRTPGKIPLDVKFPLKTVADVDDLQERLADEDFKECIVSGSCCGFMRVLVLHCVSISP